MARSLILICIGSCIGGTSRYLTQQFFQKHYPSSIPFGTLAVNIVGSLIIGMVYGLAERGNILTPSMRLFLATGICGGYTTFSSFAYENISLMRDGEFFYMSFYVLLTIIIGFAAVYLGILIIKLIH